MIPRFLGESLRALRCPPWLAARLPYSSMEYGPPRRVSSLRELFSARPDLLREVTPARPAPSLSARWVTPSREARLRHRTTLPPDYVFTLRDARLLGNAGWIVASDDTFLPEASFWREPDHPHPISTHFIFQRKRAKPLRRLPGRVLSLASDFAIGGFGHFIHDALPRLHLVEKAGHRLGDFDWVYLPRLDSPASRALTARLGVPPSKLLDHHPMFDLQAEELVGTSYPGTPGFIPDYTPAFLRERFAPPVRRTDRRIFLSREGFRRDLLQRPRAEQLLRERGFEIIRPHLEDAVSACAEAAVVVAQEGANFMNALFCPPGARLLLLLPAFIDLPYAFTLASSGAHSLWIQETPPGGSGDSLSLDLDLFAQTLDEIIT